MYREQQLRKELTESSTSPASSNSVKVLEASGAFVPSMVAISTSALQG